MNNRRAFAAVLTAVPAFVLIWAVLAIISSSQLSRDSHYIGIWGVVAATAAVLWLLAPIAVRAFSRYEKHFFVGGALLSAFGLALAVDALTIDADYVSCDIPLALGAGLLLATMFVSSFALVMPWKKGSGTLSLARWAVERLDEGDKKKLLLEMADTEILGPRNSWPINPEGTASESDPHPSERNSQ